MGAGEKAVKWYRHLLAPAVVCVALVGGLYAVGGPRRLFHGPTFLTSGVSFSITSTITAQPDCTSPALLYPGVVRCLTYTVANSQSDPITVQSISLALDPSFPLPSTCPASNLDLSHTGFTGGSYNVPANSSQALPAGLTIALLDTTQSQDACQNLTLHFKYSGTAIYTHIYATNTSLVSSANPSTVGQSVTFTATVSPVGTPPGGPTGTVTFKDGTTVLAANVALVAGQATYMTSSLSAGSHSMTATYNPSTAVADAGNFSTSTGSVSQVVNNFATATALSSSLNPSTYGTSVTFTATVTSSSGTPTGQVTFTDGTTSLGTVNVDSHGKAVLAISTLSVGSHPIKASFAGTGNFQPSTSPILTQVVNYTSCVKGTQNGGLTVPSGQAICVTGRVNGNTTVLSGGVLYLTGGTLNGNVTVQSGGSLFVTGGTISGTVTTTGAKAVSVCGASVSGTVSVSASTGFVVIGEAGDDGSPTCGANSLSSGVTVVSNNAGVEIGGNTISNTLTVNGNAGGPAGENAKPEIEANKISGGLSCATNSPAPINDGKPNTVKGNRSGQCSAAGF